ncbi:PASTA domain-containing protein [Gaetbulibacter sp. M240]|uniref:PASTA domain-containing protein n=1 Tax=Gaetbulibacter sp. M240 TaxID=3126511 RepID=UPI00374F4E9C
MRILKFLKSKLFLKQVLLAGVAVLVLSFILLKWLSVYTNHGEFETVPDLTGKSLNVAQMTLKENHLNMQVQDSANYNPDYPKFSVIEQEPPAGSKVKDNRKIYLTINPSGYRKIRVPDLTEKTLRQAQPTLEALGFKVGRLIYKDNIARDMVLQMMHDGKTIEEGDKLPKTAVIDLVLGNGNQP